MAQSSSVQSFDLSNFRNALVNGAFIYSQRGSVFNFDPANTSALIYDNWRYLHGNAVGTIPTVVVSQQYATTGISAIPGYPHWWSRVTVSNVGGALNAPSGSAFACLRTAIENIYTYEGKTAYFSFWARSSIPNKVIAVEIAPFTGSVSFAGGSKSFTLSSTWKRYSFAVKLPLYSQVLAAGHCIYIWIWMMAGNDPVNVQPRTGVAGGFGFGGTGDIEFAHVQFEADRLTPFEQLSLGDELNRCMRHLFATTTHTVGIATNGTWTGNPRINFPVPMRALPTLMNASFTATGGSAGSPAIYSGNTVSAAVYNASANWTTGALVTLNGQFSAEIA